MFVCVRVCIHYEDDLRFSCVAGFETYVAAPWKRMLAELIDTFLFVILLKAYLPEADLRCVCVCVCVPLCLSSYIEKRVCVYESVLVCVVPLSFRLYT